MKKTTKDLEHILTGTHPADFGAYLADNAGELVGSDRAFSAYMHDIIREKGLTQQQVFLAADLPERYGYKLLSQEKHTRQRDYILRLCYGADMTVEQTQRALALYGMGKLYARVPRDAALMVAFHHHRGSIQEVNTWLSEQGMEMLRSCGELG